MKKSHITVIPTKGHMPASHDTMFAPMQGAYEKEAKEMESLKMQTLVRYKKRTDEDGPANYPLCCNYAQRRQWKFAQIRGHL